jgi:hypothetical protein
MKHIALIAASALFTIGGAGAALADDCSGHSHDTGTVVGGVGGAAIGGLASHSVVGAVAGGVVGALAGNAIDRAQDCDSHRADADDHSKDRAYQEGRADGQADADAQAADASAHAYQEGRTDANAQAYNDGYQDRAAQDTPRPTRDSGYP